MQDRDHPDVWLLSPDIGVEVYYKDGNCEEILNRKLAII